MKNSNLSVKELIKDFFKFYADFEYETKVLCPFLGKILDKYMFSKSFALPKELEVHRYRMDNKNLLEFSNEPFCIQDPVELSYNMGKSVKKNELERFKNYCNDSYKVLNI